MTNELAGRRHRLPAYAWLPRTAELWWDPFAGSPVTVPRVAVALLLIGGQVAFTSGTPEWGIAASLTVILLAPAAWLLRRRSVRPSEDGAWVDCAKSAIRLIRPVVSGPGPAVVAEVGAAEGALLDTARSAAAARAAANLLVAAGADPGRLQPVGVGIEEADDDEDDEDEDEEAEGLWHGDCLVVHDNGAAFVLGLDAFYDPDDRDLEDARTRQRALVARIAGVLGAPVPAVPGGGRGRIADELQITADDLRVFADAGLASAQRLERQFETLAVDGPSDIALDLGRTRAWPSRVDAMPVRALATADPARIAAILTEDLAAQAAADRAREQRGEAVGPPVTDEWQRRWLLYLERYAAHATGDLAQDPAHDPDRDPAQDPGHGSAHDPDRDPEPDPAQDPGLDLDLAHDPAHGSAHDPGPATAPADLPEAGSRDLTPTARAALLLAATADDALRARASGPFALAAGPVTRRIRWPGHRRLALAGDRLLLAITVYVVPFTHLWAGTVR